jgi:hypothetical protein
MAPEITLAALGSLIASVFAIKFLVSTDCIKFFDSDAQ